MTQLYMDNNISWTYTRSCMKLLFRTSFLGIGLLSCLFFLPATAAPFNRTNATNNNITALPNIDVYVKVECQYQKGGSKLSFLIDGQKIDNVKIIQNKLSNKTLLIYYDGILWGEGKELLKNILITSGIRQGYIMSCYSDNINNGKIITSIERFINSH